MENLVLEYCKNGKYIDLFLNKGSKIATFLNCENEEKINEYGMDYPEFIEEIVDNLKGFEAIFYIDEIFSKKILDYLCKESRLSKLSKEEYAIMHELEGFLSER